MRAKYRIDENDEMFEGKILNEKIIFCYGSKSYAKNVLFASETPRKALNLTY